MTQPSVIVTILVLVVVVLGYSFLTGRLINATLKKRSAVLESEFEVVDASPNSFPWLDLAHYENVTAAMSREGFRCVGDFELPAMSRNFPSNRTFLRCFAGDAGMIRSCAYNLNWRGLAGILATLRGASRTLRTVEFITEFDDGTRLLTLNQPRFVMASLMPTVSLRQFDSDATVELMLECHRREMVNIILERNVGTIPVRSREDILDAMRRNMRMLADYHANVVATRTGKSRKELYKTSLNDTRNRHESN